MPVNKCQRCGAQLEDSNSRICEQCRIIHYRISRWPSGEKRGMGWYHKKERYVYIGAFGHSNATELPSTGWPHLDHRIPRICDMMPGPIRQLVNSSVYSEGEYANLTPRQREVALMWWQEGQTGAQIAETLGITVPAVTGHLNRAAKRLGVAKPKRDLGAHDAERWTNEDLDNLDPSEIKAVI